MAKGKKKVAKVLKKKARFQVPASMAPGVYRPHRGVIAPGEEFTLPDRSSHPDDLVSPHLIPMNEEARQMQIDHEIKRRELKKHGRAAAEELDPREMFKIPEPELDEDEYEVDGDADGDDPVSGSDIDDAQAFLESTKVREADK